MAVLDGSLDTTPGITAVCGPGGIGKTWLVTYWAHHVADRFPDGQLFVDLRGFSSDSDPLPPEAALGKFLVNLGVRLDQVPDDAQARTALFRSLVANRKLLLVLDNAADANQVIPLLPGGTSCAVLVTSRRSLIALTTKHDARQIRLDTLNAAQARMVLTDRMSRAEQDPEAILGLAEFCRGFPLALGIIAARVHTHPDIPLAEFVDELREFGLDALDDDDPTASVQAVLSWSYRTLTPEQRHVFGLLGIAPGPDIGLPATAALTDLTTGQARRVLRTLDEMSLVRRDANSRYSMHDLIREYAVNTARHNLAEPLAEAGLRRVVNFYLHTAHRADQLMYPYRDRIELASTATGQQLPDTAAALNWFIVERRNLLAAQHIAATHRWHDIVWQLAWTHSTFHAWRRHSHDRLTLWGAAVTAAENVEDPTVPSLVHRYFGRALAAIGRHDDAVRQLHRALVLAEEHDDLTNVGQAHYQLARLWRRHGDLDQSVDHASRALHLYRSLGRSVWEADALIELSGCASQLGDHQQAYNHAGAALALHQHHRNLGGEAATWDTIAHIDHECGHFDRAVHHHERALTIYRSLGSTSEAATTLEHLGRAHASLHQHLPARKAWQEALKHYEFQKRTDDADRVRQRLATLPKT